MNTNYSRRNFIKQASCGILAAPGVFNSVIPPNQRITMACIGTGLQGSWDTRQFLNDPRVQIVTVCDVDLQHARAMADVIENHYGKQSVSGRYRGCSVTQDFREVITRSDIDAVLVGTPDHNHALISIMAARNGKDIYCEKPLSTSVAEGRSIVNAVKQYGRVLQTGTQRRSGAIFRFGCELVRNGRIGKLHTVRIGPGRGFSIRGGFTGHEPPQPVPSDFNYDLWLGPAPWAPYTPARCHFNFRWILDYSEGYISDNGVHFVDLATWGMGTDLTGPEQIEGTAVFPTGGIYDAPTDFSITFTYANGMRLISSSSETFGVRFEGSEGWIHLSGGDVTASSESILRSEIGPGEIHLRSGAPIHQADFIDCVLSRRLPAAHAEIGHRTAAVCHLGYISCRLGRPLKWDPAREIFPDDISANRLLSKAMREPWRI